MKDSGFTLIELLLVLAIIGVISAIAIPALLGQRESSRNRATASNADNIRASLITSLAELELPAAHRALDLAGATSVQDVLTAVAARPYFDVAQPACPRNPYNQALAAYRFNALAPTLPGEVSISAPTLNGTTGSPELAIGYGIRVKGIPDLTQRVGSVDASQ